MDPLNQQKLNTCYACGLSTENSASPIEVHSETGESRRKCAACWAKQAASSIMTVEEADELSKELSDLVARVDRMIERSPKMPEMPPGLEGIAVTPLTAFRSLLLQLAEVQSRRQEILTQDGSEARINYEIKKAVDQENYERAAELKRQRDQERG